MHTKKSAKRKRVAIPPVMVEPALTPLERRKRQLADAQARYPDDDTMIPFSMLPSYGITWSAPWLRKLIKQGKFPAPYAVSEHRRGWKVGEVKKFLQSRPQWTHPQVIKPKAAA
jgi:hypothetical protein